MAMASARIPLGPKTQPFIGHLAAFSRDPLGFVETCARDYGDVSLMRVLHLNGYILNDPALIEEVLVTQNRNFIKHRSVRMRPFQLLVGNGLLTSEGDFWLRQRRLAQPAFHRDRINAYAEVMVAFTERMLESWRDGEGRDVHHDMMQLTLAIVAKTLFDSEVVDEAERVSAALEVAMERFSSEGSLLRIIDDYLPTPGRRRLARATGELDRIIYRIISEHRRAQEAGDLLSMLLAAQDDDGSRMTDRQLRDEVMTLFLAGHETTALALSWTWYLLGRNPQVEAKLVAELQNELGGRAPTLADLPRLRYTEMVLKEVLRLYPPAWSIGREAIKDCEVGGYRVRAGTQMFMVQWTMHRNPQYFEDPEAFKPERWRDDFEKRLPRFAYFPFGGGPRVCIGNAFAMMEATLILATIAQRFRCELETGQTVTPWPSITLRPKEGIRVTARAR